MADHRSFDRTRHNRRPVPDTCAKPSKRRRRIGVTVGIALGLAVLAAACTNTNFSLSGGPSSPRSGSSWDWLDRQQQQHP